MLWPKVSNSSPSISQQAAQHTGEVVGKVMATQARGTGGNFRLKEQMRQEQKGPFPIQLFTTLECKNYLPGSTSGCYLPHATSSQ